MNCVSPLRDFSVKIERFQNKSNVLNLKSTLITNVIDSSKIYILFFSSKLDDNENTGVVTIAPTAVVADPFNTDFASDVLPDKGDPFDTTHVKGGVGKAEIKALEEELDIFDDESEFDPRLEEGTKAPTKIVAAGIHILTTYYIHSIFSSQCLLLT